ncbi:hypothetical protein GRAN_1556 [Granulicella sibirica]|uniref:Uncharacterized protein n=1 Tax=Granulicella sibirica TaxID=2479048 RepID=A0A4Q0T931_9BACT|nr:hypothetical protein GRAN_1556 [Granulicella sibirica]
MDGWARVLVEVPFNCVDKAFIDYLSDVGAMDEQGRAIRPAPAKIKKIAYDLYNSDLLRESTRGRPAPPTRSHIRDEDYVPIVSHDLMKAWWQAWTEHGFSTPGETFEAYKLRIRTRANEISLIAAGRFPESHYVSDD